MSLILIPILVFVLMFFAIFIVAAVLIIKHTNTNKSSNNVEDVSEIAKSIKNNISKPQLNLCEYCGSNLGEKTVCENCGAKINKK